MNKKKFLLIIFSVVLFLLVSCINMPTPPEQIGATYLSGIEYERYDCNQLQRELDHLRAREVQLVAAQEQRYQSSIFQSFWLGIGDGDGLEASELANTRGKIVAVERMMNRKNCPPIKTPLEK